ncbi:MAG TPA: family 10 glycosylhydrolase, partial [Gemmatimonadaceae bacterium]
MMIPAQLVRILMAGDSASGRVISRGSMFAVAVCVAAMPKALPSQSSVHAAAPPPAAIPCSQADTACVPPRAAREFRGVWVASVRNLDWPSRPGLPPSLAKAELIALLDRAAALGLNAVLLQVRPAGDALYASKIEPWSEYLTGRQGMPPVPLWDPLQFAVAQAHARGLELHAWFNPFRAKEPSAKGPLAPTHLARRHPELVKKYGTQLWMDPGEPAVRAQTLRVVLDVVKRYDIDGIHLDDYFYPYPERRPNGSTDFPDDRSWKAYRKHGGKL